MRHVELEAYWDGEAWCARGRRHSIYTFADTLDKLLENVKEAVAVHFELPPGESVEVVLRVKADVPEMAARQSSKAFRMAGLLALCLVIGEVFFGALPGLSGPPGPPPKPEPPQPSHHFLSPR